MTKYNVSPLVAREIEFSTGTIFGGSWCRYFISIYNAIEKWESDHRETEIFQQLAVSELFNQLNK